MNYMKTLNTISENICFGGTQGVYEHHSDVTNTPMRFAVFVPQQLSEKPLPVIWWLSGLTCNEQNFITKAGAQQFAAQHGVIIVAPDTSPRGAGIQGEDDAYDFGTGAGFYVDATVTPWSHNYNMFSYISNELPDVIADNFTAANLNKQSIMGHSMGGHGALIIALKNPGRFASVSAFAPICNPADCAWGQKALSGYLGQDSAVWRQWDAANLIADGAKCPALLIDQGAADEFLHGGQLRPEALEAACEATNHPLTLRRQDGYDHSFYFIASFVGEHIAHHTKALLG